MGTGNLLYNFNMKITLPDRDFLAKLIAIALPIGLQSVVNMVVNLIDTVMVGSLGDIVLSSVNISSQFPYLYMTVFMGIGNAAVIIASQAWGNNRADKVSAILAFCMKIAVVVNIVFFLLAFSFPRQILSIYTDNAGIIEAGTPYLRILSFTFLIQSFSQNIVTVLRSAGVNKLGFYSSTLACVINMIFNWLMIFGHFGFPRMGVAGAGVATVIARIIEFAVVARYLFHNDVLPFTFDDFRGRLDSDMKADFVRVGTPSIISEVTGNLNVSAAAMITGRVSPYYIAANTIVHNIWTISSLFLFGIAMGASVMIGHEIGAKRMDKADEYASHFIMIGVVIGAAAAVLTQIIAPLITSFFSVSEETLLIAAKLTRAAGIAVFFLAMQLILTKGILRGGGQAAAVTKVDLLSCWLVNIPAGFVTALILHADPFFIYLSLRIDYLIKTIWGLWRIRKGDWIIRMNVD